jgi:ribosome-binding factor A
MRTRMKDPRIGFASITGVELSHDLRYAKVFVSVMGSPEEQRETMRGLDSANGFLRRELAQRLTIRHVPEISFRLDESIARGARVLDLLKQVEKESAVPASAENAGDESD